MRRRSKIAVILVILALAGAGVYFAGVFKTKPLTLKGAVITRDPDPRRQLPVSDVHVIVRLETGSEVSSLFNISNTSKQLPLGEAVSDNSGFFNVTLPKDIRRGRAIRFEVSHSEYHPLLAKDYVGDQLYVLSMEPLRHDAPAESKQPDITIGNVLVRYSAKTTTAANIGSAAKTFEVVNQGNVPCNGHDPCSPDGRWKAAVGSVTLDAGTGNEFRNARASCIAGPCPFTRIDERGLTNGGPTISVSARNWSNTAVFLVEAEVVHPMVSDIARESHPYVLGRALNFTVPATAEGITLQAELNGETIVFPLGPALILSWADCTSRVDTQKNKAYRCELKPNYRFNRSQS
jgi:hypothetical protein